MNNEISLDNMNYFNRIQERVTIMNKQLQEMGNFAKDRQKKYENCLTSYEKYILKQKDVLKSNMRHCQSRNKFYFQQVKKAWRNGISNRPIVLRSLARTNVIKRDADQWITRMEDQAIGPYQHSVNYANQQLSESQLIQKYNEILRQHNFK